MATFAEPSIDSEAGKCNKKKRRRNRFIKQGYHKSEREDARRVAARAFLSGIPLDSHAPYTSHPGSSPIQNFHSQLPLDSINAVLSSQTLPGSFSGEVSQLAKTPSTQEVVFGSPKYSHKKFSPIHLLPSHEVASPSDYIFCDLSPSDSFDKGHLAVNELSGNVCICYNTSKIPPAMLLDKQLMFFCKGESPSSVGSLLAVSSVIGYKREREQDIPQRTRTRANSTSLQIDLDVELGTTSSDDIEVSLGFLLYPIWVSEQTNSDLTPPFTRRMSGKKGDPVKRLSDPRPVRAFHWKSAATHQASAGYPWGFFKENHSPDHVIMKYHPQCLDNYEYFTGSRTVTFLLEGKRLSVIQYARPSDIKKAINERFATEFPHVRISLSKLRSIKRDMHKAALESDVDLDAVAYSYVYFERLILMGKINKANRKIIAGVCLLLAAKFYTDTKQKDIKNLIDRLADHLHLSTKELILYEFPILVSLQFSLLVPYYQANPHLLALRDSELALN